MKVQVPLPQLTYDYKPKKKRLHVQFSAKKLIVAAVVVVAGLFAYKRFNENADADVEAVAQGSPAPAPSGGAADDGQAAGGGRIATRQPGSGSEVARKPAPDQGMTARPAKAAPKPDAKADEKAKEKEEDKTPALAKPTGKKDSDIARTMKQAGAGPGAEEKAKGNPIPDFAKASEPKPAPKAEKKAAAAAKSIKTAAQWKAMLDRAKALMENPRWDAAGKILKEVGTDGPTREGAEARILLKKIPPEFQPKDE
jgi:hypothetical protein